jgi:hypothetical protein
MGCTLVVFFLFFGRFGDRGCFLLHGKCGAVQGRPRGTGGLAQWFIGWLDIWV